MTEFDWTGVRELRARSQNDVKKDGSYVFPRPELTCFPKHATHQFIVDPTRPERLICCNCAAVTLLREGERVLWSKNENTGLAWIDRDQKLATVQQDYYDLEDSVRIRFDDETGTVFARFASLTRQS